MKPARFHAWNVTPDEASAIQLNLREKIEIKPLSKSVHLVAGTGVVFEPNSETIHAAVVVLRFPDMELVERYGVTEKIIFPYVSGLLAFREGPPLMRAFREIRHQPDIIFFHAHGQSHPRRFGLASHLGVLLDMPAVGITTKLLVGFHEEIGLEKGHHAPLMDADEEIGLAVRTKENVNPVYVSVGHKANLLTALDFMLECITHYRHPEPLRQAQLAANAQKDGESIDIDVGGDQTTLF